MMRWNHLILALLGVCILSKGVHCNGGGLYVGGTDDNDDYSDDKYGVKTTPENIPDDDDGFAGSRLGVDDQPSTIDVTPFPEVITSEPVDGPEHTDGTTIEPETHAPDGNSVGPGGNVPDFWPFGKVQKTTPEDISQEPTDAPKQPSVDDEATTTEDIRVEDTTPDQSPPKAPGDQDTTPEPDYNNPKVTDVPDKAPAPAVDPVETTSEPSVPDDTKSSEPVEETTPEDLNPKVTDVPDKTLAPAVDPVETTPEDSQVETTEDYVEKTTEDSSGAKTPEPIVKTTEDPFGTGGNNQGVESTTESDVEPTTEDDLSYLKNMANAKLVPNGPWGNGKEYTTMDPADLAALPVDTAIGVLPDGTPLDTLSDDYIVVDGQDDWSKVVANKNGFFVLHPVQTSGNNAIFDPYTIGQVLGYIYEFQEFGGNRPNDGWTIELMGKPIPNAVRRKRSEGVKSRRATLVFTKKADVVAKEEHDYWKKVIASI